MYGPNRIMSRRITEMELSTICYLINFQKVFDSLDRDSLWKLLRHYGISEKIVTIIRSSHSGVSNRGIHERKTSETCNVLIGV